MSALTPSAQRTAHTSESVGGLSARERAALRAQLAQVSTELRGWVAELDGRIERLAAVLDQESDPAAAAAVGEGIGGGS